MPVFTDYAGVDMRHLPYEPGIYFDVSGSIPDGYWGPAKVFTDYQYNNNDIDYRIQTREYGDVNDVVAPFLAQIYAGQFVYGPHDSFSFTSMSGVLEWYGIYMATSIPRNFGFDAWHGQQFFIQGGPLYVFSDLAIPFEAVTSADFNPFNAFDISVLLPDLFAGSDTLYGVAGSVLFGLGGDDYFHFLSSGATATGGDGDDTFYEAEARYAPAATDHDFYGGPGDDRYVISYGSRIHESPNEGNDIVELTELYNNFFPYTLPEGVERLFLHRSASVAALGNSLANRMTGNSGNDSFQALGGNDTLSGAGGNDTLDGGAGIDTGLYASYRRDYTISGSAADRTVSGPEGVDTLVSVERLQFFDTRLAFDLGAGEAAANTARIVGALFDAPALTAHPAYVGIGLALFDGGLGMTEVCERALASVGPLSNEAFVNRVYANIVGSAPAPAELARYVSLLQGNGGTLSQAELLALAANTDANAINIDLAGLQRTGIDYL